MVSSGMAEKVKSGMDRTRETSDREHIASLVRASRVDASAFEGLYRLHVEAVYRFCFRRLGHAESAADATSQTFIKAFANIRHCDETRFRAWLFTIAAHSVVDEWRARKPESVLDYAASLVSRDQTPEEQYLVEEDRKDVRALLEYLTPYQRRVVELRLAGLNGEEIAAALGKNRGAVDTAQSRAISRLRAILCDENKASDTSEVRYESA